MSNHDIMNQHIRFMGEFMTNMNALTAGVLKDLREQYAISNEQSSVLLMLSHEKALTLTEITIRQGVNKAAVSRRVKKLLELELVQFAYTNDDADRRLKYVELTEYGMDFVHDSRNLITELATEVLSDIPQDEIEETRAVLEKIDTRLKGLVRKSATSNHPE
ncbi:MarR family transcriptional regulator [Staphylococcus muscae]|uniref:Transcriptional regulator n=1 Tax=Staphylococcus muscae TaxID=1294 RepID=A0A240CAM6_9STAP|nr:MarR family transcriptional regulator [Staphylococcus muscae]AVQ33738.1 MarR family transcriptional regulator [Staphylococcus muscae]PNZ03599.1 MarR family transcriptional regulator [Staphylococcus muscae]GGA87355.1 transcriptional regulator [Staphylococcus muscae]SNW04128.1 HTH-type transcriptional regulator TcaR [Staphylococcus muscae]